MKNRNPLFIRIMKSFVYNQRATTVGTGQCDLHSLFTAVTGYSPFVFRRICLLTNTTSFSVRNIFSGQIWISEKRSEVGIWCSEEKHKYKKNTNTNINTDIDIGEAVGSEDMMLWGLSSPMTRGGSRDQSALLCPKGKIKATIEGWIIASSGLMCFSLTHGMQPYFARALFFTQCAMHSFCTKGFLRIW